MLQLVCNSFQRQRQTETDVLGEGIVFSWVSLSGVFGQSLNEEGVKGVFSRLRLRGESDSSAIFHC